MSNWIPIIYWIPIAFIIGGSLLWAWGILEALTINDVPFFTWLKCKIRATASVRSGKEE